MCWQQGINRCNIFGFQQGLRCSIGFPTICYCTRCYQSEIACARGGILQTRVWTSLNLNFKIGKTKILANNIHISGILNLNLGFGQQNFLWRDNYMISLWASLHVHVNLISFKLGQPKLKWFNQYAKKETIYKFQGKFTLKLAWQRKHLCLLGGPNQNFSLGRPDFKFDIHKLSDPWINSGINLRYASRLYVHVCHQNFSQ